MTGKLYLVPTPLDHGCTDQVPLERVLPLHTVEAAARLRCWICENAKSTRAFLARVRRVMPLACDLKDMEFKTLPRAVRKKGDAVAPADIASLLQAVIDGHDAGLSSEAGMPAVADPGASVVRAAHERGIEVIALVGPASMLLALAASGMNGQNYACVGYLPVDPDQRARRIRELEALAIRTGQTQQFIETPYRNGAMLDALLDALNPTTRLALACGLTLDRQWIRTATVAKWKSARSLWPIQPPLDLPAVFSIGP